LSNNVNVLSCNNNPIKCIKYLLYIPSMFESNINISTGEIYKNRIIYGLNNMTKIFKNKKKSIRIQKIWQKYWYTDIIYVNMDIIVLIKIR